MTVRPLHLDDINVVPDALLETLPAQRYIAALDESIPGLDLTWDRAIAIGFLAAREIRAGRYDEHRAIAAQSFDPDEYDVLALAAVSLLDPGPVPEPFASIITLTERGAASGLSPAAFAAKLIDDGEDG